jgi:hypothetical protein
MTKANRIFSTAALALMMVHSATSAYAAEAMTPADAAPAATSPFVTPSYLLPAQPVGNALLPAHRSIEQIAAEERSANLEAERAKAWRRRWMISLAPLVTSNIMDSSSSWGLHELNPALAGADGRFGMKAVGIKFSVVGGLIGGEYLLVKKFPKSAKFFTFVNLSTAGITSGLAMHNYMLPGR